MKTTRSVRPRLRSLSLAGAALLLLAAVPGRAHAAFLLTLTQTGGNVVVTGSGTLNTTALTFLGTTTTQATLNPSAGVLFAGSPAFTTVNLYNGGGLTGPAAFGTGSGNSPGAGMGSFVGIVGSGPKGVSFAARGTSPGPDGTPRAPDGVSRAGRGVSGGAHGA